MNDPHPRFWPLFLELFESLPRQGPGNRACAVRALSYCTDLPPHPAILDLGCGVGAQTLDLAELTAGTLVAIDQHAPSIERLKATLAAQGLNHRVRALVGDMAELDPALGPFDLVWSEGALYNIGLANALRVCHGLLHPGGYLAFTDAVWRKANPPPEVKAGFDDDYPTMGWVDDVLTLVDQSGFDLLGHFTLPDEAWWTDFYTPMQRRIDEMRRQYAGDHDAASILDQLAREPELHRRYSDYYAYEFFIARRR
ncbi:MAG: class I SAM-dependent methyltransferase [Thiotrichales bacterium]